MTHSHVKYLLIGGGAASLAAAEAIRSIDGESSLLLVGQEVVGPYRRPLLSGGYLLEKTELAALYTVEPEWFARNRIELRTGRRVSRLDPGRHTATLDSGEEVAFDAALVATGATPSLLRVPGADLPNVYTLRTIQEADRIHNMVEKALVEGRPHAKGRGRALVVGAGLLGVDLAGVFARLGIGVDLVSVTEYPWQRYCGVTVGRHLVRLLEDAGVKVHAGTTVLRLEGDGRAQRGVLSSGTSVECDFVVTAIGVEPNKALLRGTSIVAEKAILVDDRCRTSAVDVYAAGDCAAILDPLFGKYRVLDHWDGATAMGRIAGINMAGGIAAFDDVSHFRSTPLGVPIDVWGAGRFAQRRIVRGAAVADTQSFLEIGVGPDGRVVQVIRVGATGDSDGVLKQMVKQRVQVEGREEQIKDPAVPLEKAAGIEVQQ